MLPTFRGLSFPATVPQPVSMGNFQQHLTCSTLTGIALSGAAYHCGIPLPTCLLAGGFCSMAGMLPDIDSGSSRSFQECISIAAAMSAFLLAQRLRIFLHEPDIIMLSAAGVFLFVRFVVGGILRRVTVHRGMFHSIPAAVLVGLLTFFVSTGTISERLLKAIAPTVGYLSHLLLDEWCSIDSSGKKPRLKKSFGTALKFYDSKHAASSLVLYALIVFLSVTAIKQPEMIEKLDGASGTEHATSQRPSDSKVENRDHSNRSVSPQQTRKQAIREKAAEYLTRFDPNRSATRPKPDKATTWQAAQSQLPQDKPLSSTNTAKYGVFSRNSRRGNAKMQPNRTTSSDVMATYSPPLPSRAVSMPGLYSNHSDQTSAASTSVASDLPPMLSGSDFRAVGQISPFTIKTKPASLHLFEQKSE